MIKIYTQQGPLVLTAMQIGGVCPHCKTGTRFTLTSTPTDRLPQDQAQDLIASYSCDLCVQPIAVHWNIQGYSGNQPVVREPRMIVPVREPFDFAHVPEEVAQEIQEGLDCLSVGAFNGFAALCRRTIQAICTNLGAGASTKVKSQIEEMARLTGIEEEWKDLAIQIMLAGHDGSHPHLPDVNADRAAILLALLRDLTYQLYTRPGKVREAATLRRAGIESQKPNTG